MREHELLFYISETLLKDVVIRVQPQGQLEIILGLVKMAEHQEYIGSLLVGAFVQIVYFYAL